MTNALTNTTPPGRIPAFAFTWLPVLLSLAALYYPTYAYLVQNTWTQDENAHGPLILGMAAYLAWQRRHVFSAGPARPHLSGWVALAFGLLLYAVGRSQDVIMMDVASQIPVLAGILLITRGAAALRSLWFPLLFLVFMIPLPGFLVDGATGSLKLLVSQVAEQVLYFLDYPIGRTGVTLTIGHYQLLVADACSGLYSMFSLTAVGLLYVYLMRHRNGLRNGILLASILPIAFAANCVRVVVLSLVTYHFGEAAGQGLVHDLASPMLFTVAILLMAGLDALLGSFLAGSARAGKHPGPPADPAPETPPARPGSRLRYLSLAVMIASGIGLAQAMVPSHKAADAGPALDLESRIPGRFGDWRLDPSTAPLRADPETTAYLDKLYNQILSRTYIHDQGEMIMLMIAYGGDQSESMQVHKPEVCYPAQGFQVFNEAGGSLDTGLGAIPVRRLTAVLGPRVEPVTYWMTIGDKIAQGGGGAWKLEQMKYGLTGRIPDGLLFRVSSFSRDEAAAHRLQERFVQDLVAALPAADRPRFIGRPTP